MNGSIKFDSKNPINFTTGENDHCLAIQFSNDTPIDYAELIEGTASEAQHISYEENLDKFDFQAYNKKQTSDLINTYLNEIRDRYNPPLHETFNEFTKHEGYLVGVQQPEANQDYDYYEFIPTKDINLYFKQEDYGLKKYLCISLFINIEDKCIFIKSSNKIYFLDLSVHGTGINLGKSGT